MPKKVYEIAKELEMESKELLEKINSMGIEAKSHNSTISDIDAKVIENMILRSRNKVTETKIVKAAPSNNTNKNVQEEVKISVKPASVINIKPKERTEVKTRPEQRPMQTRQVTPPKGVPQPKSASVQPANTITKPAVKPPQGVPLPKSAGAKPPQGVPLPKSASVQAPIGVPLPKSASLQPVKEKYETVGIDKEKPETGKIEKKTEAIAKTANNDNKEILKKEIISAAADIKTPDATTEIKKDIATETKTAVNTVAETINKNNTTQDKKPVHEQRQTVTDKKKTDTGQRKHEQDNARQKQVVKRTEPEQRHSEQAQKKNLQEQKRPEYKRPEPEIAKAVSPRQKKVAVDAVPPEIPAKKGKKEKSDESWDRIEGKRDLRKQLTQKISMEKPLPKKPHKQKAEKIVEPENKINLDELAPGTKVINVPITVKGLSEQIGKTTSEIIMSLMKLGIMANVNQNIDEDTAILLGAELGINIVVDKVSEETIEEGLENFEDREEDLRSRPPIITVMGHVDHGKTSLLDAIRKTSVTATESGGITQHIGASEVIINGQKIVFLDTPGHEAFTAMRARGAHVTDIAVLVVAADDSVKPQTIESISHAKAAGVPMIVAINKMDKESANPDRVKQDLANLPSDQRVLVEEWGGDTICVPVSAKTGEGIKNLLEMILLQAEVLELKANPNRLAMGTVIEARLDKAKGPVATLLVLNGTLQAGMSVVAGTCSGRIRAMTNYKGDKIRKAGPATAVEILGLTEVPEAGDEFNAVKEDKTAREIAEHRKMKVREEVMVKNSSVTLEQLFSQIQEGEVKELNLIIKADVQGSVGALTQSLEKLHTENVKVKIIHSGVGTINESDIMLANTSNAIIIGFNVRPSSNIVAMAERENVEIRTYRIIYEIIDEIEAALKGMLDPVYKEVVLGKIEIRDTFKVPGVGIIGGAYVLEGKVQRNAEIRLVRDGIVIHEGKISSLKRFKDDVKEVAQGYECGIGIENYNDIKEGDIIEAFKMEEIERK